MAGELSLNGEVKGVKGILPIVDMAVQKGCRLCIIPEENRKETAFIDRIPILGIRSIREFLEYAKLENWGATKNPAQTWETKREEEKEDFSDILGQEAAKRAAVIAAAGFHNLLLIGTRGSGKTMIAERIPTIFPNLSQEEAMEISRIYSAAGLLSEKNPVIKQRPFRAPHHTISPKALAGGGQFPGPGEITLAHKGVLFLDELPEFSRGTLEILRQPMESRHICISRIHGVFVFPADFLLVAAMNPCRCGYYPDRNRCSCTESDISRYLGKISGPLLDRFDLCTEAADVPMESLWKKEKGKTSAQIRKEIVRVHEIQRRRYEGTGISFNGALSGKMAEEYCTISKEAEKLLKKAYEKMNFSVRAYHKILKTARTIADLEGSAAIETAHISEAVFYRAMDRKYWK